MKKNQPYKETQSFVTWWLWLFFLFIIGVNLYIACSSGEKILTDFSFGILAGLLVAAILFFQRLHTRIDNEGIHIRFFPFIWKEKTWRWEEIGDVYVKKYSPWQYGGWGYRFGRGGIAYTTKGVYGIHFVIRRNGASILVGTQKPEEVGEVLKQYHQVS